MLYHVTVTHELYEYYRVEADSEMEAQEKVLEKNADPYNWDQALQLVEVEGTTELNT